MDWLAEGKCPMDSFVQSMSWVGNMLAWAYRRFVNGPTQGSAVKRPHACQVVASCKLGHIRGSLGHVVSAHRWVPWQGGAGPVRVVRGQGPVCRCLSGLPSPVLLLRWSSKPQSSSFRRDKDSSFHGRSGQAVDQFCNLLLALSSEHFPKYYILVISCCVTNQPQT